jgi:hypothetical protein
MLPAGLAAAILALTAISPAAACTIAAGQTRADHLAAADVVFTGTAVRVDDSTNGRYFSSLDPLYWTFAVDDVEKGQAPDRVTVATAIGSESCGYTFELGKRYRVYAAHSEWYDHLATGLGSGNTELAPQDDPPRVEGEFHTLEYHLYTFVPVGLPALALIGVGFWVLRRSRA